MKILFCGPWFGEFGWEIVWQGFCRKMVAKHDFDKVVVCSFKTSESLYSDFADEFIEHDLYGKSHLFYMDAENEELKAPSCYNYLIQKIHKKYRMKNYKKDIFFFHPKISNFLTKYYVIDMHGDHKKHGLYPLISTEKPIYDIIIHARKRKYVKYRNWEQKNWDNFIEKISDKNLKIACVGTEAYALKNTIDLTNQSLDITRQAIRSSKVMIGPSSGPMILGLLENIPVLTWGPSKEEIPHVHLRYTNTWNFHKSPVRYIENDDFNPSVEKVLEIYDDFCSN